MKFRLTFKTPDVAYEVFREMRINNETYENQANAEDLVRRYVKYGELITIEFDTETRTAKVVPV